jgi:hypothetical protein
MIELTTLELVLIFIMSSIFGATLGVLAMLAICIKNGWIK